MDLVCQWGVWFLVFLFLSLNSSSWKNEGSRQRGALWENRWKGCLAWEKRTWGQLRSSKIGRTIEREITDERWMGNKKWRIHGDHSPSRLAGAKRSLITPGGTDIGKVLLRSPFNKKCQWYLYLRGALKLLQTCACVTMKLTNLLSSLKKIYDKTQDSIY